MKKKYSAPKLELIKITASYDVLSVSTSSKTGEDDVPDVPVVIEDEL